MTKRRNLILLNLLLTGTTLLIVPPFEQPEDSILG